MKGHLQNQKSKWIAIMSALIVVVILAGCSTPNQANHQHQPASRHSDSKVQYQMQMGHSSSAAVPEQVKAAANPAYPIGSKVLIHANHRDGMQGAEGTVTGAYDTIAYMVTFKPVSGEPKVEHYKWVIHEEIVGAGTEMLEPGTEVTLKASHMKGMEGAAAVIESAAPSTVYRLNYIAAGSGEEVKNQKWVVEGELAAI